MTAYFRKESGMFSKIFESKEKQHARHLAWARAHPEEMKALIRKGLVLTNHGDGLKYIGGYYVAAMVWCHHWFWADTTDTIIASSLARLHDCGYHDFVFAVPSFTDTALCPDEVPWPESTVTAIYWRYINRSQDVVQHYHMDQWYALMKKWGERLPRSDHAGKEYDNMVRRARRWIRKSGKFKW